MTKSIAFHSYKGGTGKTTISANFAASLAKKGYRVCLLDLDVYAPSLHSYFDIEPKKWINDYLNSKADVDEVLVDVTHKLQIPNDMDREISKKKSVDNGKLFVSFSSSKKEDIYKLEVIGDNKTRKQLLRKFILLRELLSTELDMDYIIIDTSPGIRYWSINSLAVSDILLLTLKMGDIDIEGTRRIIHEVYESFNQVGATSFLLWNRIMGYCIPNHSTLHDNVQIMDNDTANIDKVSQDVGMVSITSVPCYCDIQFLKKEFLTCLKYPYHPFAKKIEYLIAKIESLQ